MAMINLKDKAANNISRVYMIDDSPGFLDLIKDCNFISFAFIFFILFSINYNATIYFFPANRDKVLMPFYISVLKDIPWAVVVAFTLFQSAKSFKNKECFNRNYYNPSNQFVIVFFVFVHIILLIVALSHLSHKNIIHVLQRDIKNVQYISIPLLLYFLIKNRKDIFKYVNIIIAAGACTALFGLVIYFFIPNFLFKNVVISTMPGSHAFGFFMAMLFLLNLPNIFLEKEFPKGRFAISCLFYAAILTSNNISSVLSVCLGTLFVLIMIKPSLKSICKVFSWILLVNILFYGLGLYDRIVPKCINAYSGAYKYTQIDKNIGKKQNYVFYDINNIDKILSIEFLSNPYYQVPENLGIVRIDGQSSIVGRVWALYDFWYYYRDASFKDLLFGDFNLKNFYEYDSSYLYFARNDGIITVFLFLALLLTGFFAGVKKYKLFMKSNNIEMAALALGITAFLLFSTVIQFNTAMFLTFYPLNFYVYFFLLLICFMPKCEETAK